jgi:hypothetical protein
MIKVTLSPIFQDKGDARKHYNPRYPLYDRRQVYRSFALDELTGILGGDLEVM